MGNKVFCMIPGIVYGSTRKTFYILPVFPSSHIYTDVWHLSQMQKKKMIGTNLCLEASEKVGIEFPH